MRARLLELYLPELAMAYQAVEARPAAHLRFSEVGVPMRRGVA
jgi:hypothetical protein